MIIGLVGKPSAGKSTFFKAATLAEVEIANYPFTTINKNEGFGYVKVKDPALDFGKRSNPRTGFCLGDWRFVPVEMIDVAGLVPGAHEGKGRGNQFLDDLRQADVLIHVVDTSGSINENGEDCGVGNYDPAKDILFLEEELDFWYFGIMKKGWEKFARQVQQEKAPIHKALGKQLSGLKVTESMVEDMIKKLNLDVSKPIEWTDEMLFNLARELRKKTKPMIIACNKIDVGIAIQNFERLKKEYPDRMLFACSAESELALREAGKHQLINYIPGENYFTISELGKQKLNERQQKALEFIRTNILQKQNTTGVQDILNKAVFELLKYITIFPGGVNKLEDSEGRVIPDCFLMPGTTTALDFAFRLHTDFGKKFICAKDCRTKQTIGKEHVLKSQDVIEIVANR